MGPSKKYRAYNEKNLRLWAYVLSGAAFGATYGMLTMSTEIISGCFQQPAPFCGILGSFLNMPAILIINTFISKESLHMPLVTLIGVMVIDVSIGSFLGLLAARKFKKNALGKFGIALFTMIFILLLPFILFFIASGP
jgi:hypothetical protein